MNVVLSHGYFLKEDKAEQKIMMPYPPQGLLHVGTFLKKNGIDCRIYDTSFKSFDQLSEFLENEKPKYLGLYTNLMTRPNILKIINFIRQSDLIKGIVIILGGPDVRYHSTLYIQHGADYCISGEGENAFFQLISLLNKKDFVRIQTIKGLSFRNKDQEIIAGSEPEITANIDELPFPDFELIDLSVYFKIWEQFHGYSSITISTMRGCPYNCRWCSKAVFGRSFRRRSVASVVIEMQRLQKQYAPDRFWIVDDVFTINKQWLSEFRDVIISNNHEFKYECITRADKLDTEIIKMLKESGCFRLWIGAESGSQKVLDLMDRGVKAAVVREMIKETKKTGIEAGTFLMLGYPGETEVDIIETVNHLKDAKPDHFTTTLSYPIPGTEFYNDIKNKELTIPGAWGTYSDRDLNFKRTYNSKYYPHAIRYINHAVKAHYLKPEKQGIQYVKHHLIALVSRGLMILNRL